MNLTSMQSRMSLIHQIQYPSLHSEAVTYQVTQLLMLQARALNWTKHIADPEPVPLSLSELGMG